jgi:nucleoside phosphorylase
MKIVLFIALETELPRHIVRTIPMDIQPFYTGVGKINSTIVSTDILRYYNPKDTLVMNFGSAGGPEEMKHTLVKCNRFRQGDINTEPLYSKGVTPYDEYFYDWDTTEINTGGGGFLCTTTDTFNTKPEGIVDMESYGIAKVCKRLSFPFMCYKWISDSGDTEDWKQNHNMGIENFIGTLKQIKL